MSPERKVAPGMDGGLRLGLCCQFFLVCAATGVPLVYDVHHHRCLPDGASVAETTRLARATWRTEPLFHISSPLEGWGGLGESQQTAAAGRAWF